MIAYQPNGRPTADEIVERGERIYQERLRGLLEPQHNGQVIVIDVESGDYELGEECREVSDRIAARHPDAPLYAGRVGFASLYRIGYNGGMARP